MAIKAAPTLKVHSGSESKSYTSLPADINAITIRPGYASGAAPHDMDTVPLRPRQIIVHDTGNLKLSYDDDDTITDTIPILAVPTYLNVQPYKIWTTGTTVTNITIIW